MAPRCSYGNRWRLVPGALGCPIMVDTVPANLSLLNEERERSMLATLVRLEDTIRKETEYATILAALRELESRDIPAAADARRRVERLHVCALARSGELCAALDTAAGRPRNSTDGSVELKTPKLQALKDAGLKQQRASEREAIARVQADAPEEFEAALQTATPAASVKALVKKQKREQRRTVADADLVRARSTGVSARVEIGDVRDLDVGEFVDAIVTDPPYPREYLPLFRALAETAARVLKPGALLVVMSGQSYLPEVYAALDVPGLEYRWTAAYMTPGGQAVQLWDRGVNTFWKPLLVYVKLPRPDEWKWVGDVARSDVNDNDKRFHEWGQSESGMLDVIDRFTEPGDLVLDPFCGAGTTGAACLALARNFLGFDVDADRVSLACERLGL